MAAASPLGRHRLPELAPAPSLPSDSVLSLTLSEYGFTGSWSLPPSPLMRHSASVPALGSRRSSGRSKGGAGRRRSPNAKRGSPTPVSPFQRRLQKAVRSFDKRLNQAFDEQEALAQQYESRSASPVGRGGDPGARTDVGLSNAARRQNFKKERFHEQVEKGAEAASASLRRPGQVEVAERPGRDAIQVASEAAFLEQVAELDHQIDHLEKSLRFESFEGDVQDKKAMAEREEARRAREADLRRARKKEQEARDPKKKIALRIENKRRFDEGKIDAGVPMQIVDVLGSTGKEQVRLVDVRVLASKCVGLDQGDRTVKSLLTTHRRREQARSAPQLQTTAFVSMNAYTAGSPTGSAQMTLLPSQLSEDAVASPRASVGSAPASPSSIRTVFSPPMSPTSPPPITRITSLSWEERVAMAKGGKMEKHAENMLSKMGTMRTKTPYKLPYSFTMSQDAHPESGAEEPKVRVAVAAKHNEKSSFRDGELFFGVVKRAMSTNQQLFDEIRKRDSPPRRTSTLRLDNSEQTSLDDTLPPKPKRLIEGSAGLKKLVDDMGLEGVSRASSPDKDLAKRKGPKTRGKLADLQKQQAARLKAKRQWAHARAAVTVLVLLFTTRTRNRSIEVTKTFLAQLGEWSRMKYAMSRMRRSVHTFQGVARSFLASKKKHCDQLQREWQRVEDNMLATFFKSYVSQLVNEHRQELAGNPRSGEGGADGKKKRTRLGSHKEKALYKYLQDSVDSGNVSIDWKVYRIPVKERRAIIGRYYMSSLKKRVQFQKNLLATVQSAVESERELIRFLKMFGAPDKQAEAAFSSPSAGIAAGEPKEGQPFWFMAEETILQLITLAAQSLAQIEPYQEHPANRDRSFEIRRSKSSLESKDANDGGSAGEGNEGQKTQAIALDLREVDRAVGASLGRVNKRGAATATSADARARSPSGEAQEEEKPQRMDVEEMFSRMTLQSTDFSGEEPDEYPGSEG